MTEKKIDLSAGMIPKKPTHALGEITGWSHDDGLPIVKRKTADVPAQSQANTAEKPAQKQAEPTKLQPAKPANTPAKAQLQPAGSPLTKGAPVRLQDGTTGKVAHVIANMKTVRVRTDDGRNLTLRHDAVKVMPHVQVAAHTRRLPE